jgi:benzoyl-CoA 2,3-dioxygenase component A
MAGLAKQHLIDPELCIRCYTCEASCPVGAIEHDANNVVVDASKCEFCMSCIAPCPTGSIDNWRVVERPYGMAEQYAWRDLPAQAEYLSAGSEPAVEATDEAVARLLADAHAGGGGHARAPASAARPSINLYTIAKPAEAMVQGNYRLTAEGSDADVRHIILDLGAQAFPVLEGQSVGILAPGLDNNAKPHLPRLYSVSSPRDGERANFNNLSLTVKRETGGVCSNHVCDLKKGDRVALVGPFGSTFLMPNDPAARVLMICTGTGSAPFRAFTMRRQRVHGESDAPMMLVFGARTPDSLPYFGPLGKVPASIIEKHLVFSRIPGKPKEYVQDRLRRESERVADFIAAANAHVYVCGLREMERGVDEALASIAEGVGLSWQNLREAMRAEGRYHVETY